MHGEPQADAQRGISPPPGPPLLLACSPSPPTCLCVQKKHWKPPEERGWQQQRFGVIYDSKESFLCAPDSGCVCNGHGQQHPMGSDGTSQALALSLL